MCELEKEVKLLREKVELMEKVKELEMIKPKYVHFIYTGDPYPYDPFTTLTNHYPTTWGTN